MSQEILRGTPAFRHRIHHGITSNRSTLSECWPRLAREYCRSLNGARRARPNFPYMHDCANPRRPLNFAALAGVSFRSCNTLAKSEIKASFFFVDNETSAELCRIWILVPSSDSSCVGFCSFFWSSVSPKMSQTNFVIFFACAHRAI